MDVCCALTRPGYAAAQLAGAFLAAGLDYGVYYDAIQDFDRAVRPLTSVPHMLDGAQNPGAAVDTGNNSASIFLPWPQPGLSVAGAFFDQVIGTGLLLFGIFAVLDPRKCAAVLLPWRLTRGSHVGRGAQPALIGLLMVVIQIGFSFNCGA